MTARRGSIRFRVSRFARAPLKGALGSSSWKKRATTWTHIGSRVAIGAVALFVTGAFGAQMWHVGAENYRLHKQIDTVERRNDALSEQSNKLARQITLLHDPDYLVPLIHEQLGLVKPHEVFIEIQPTSAPSGN